MVLEMKGGEAIWGYRGLYWDCMYACLLQVCAVLSHIETGNLLPPLVVLSILAKNPTLQLGIVKDYIARQLSAESAHIQEDRAQIAKYQQETAHMRAEVRELRTQVS